MSGLLPPLQWRLGSVVPTSCKICAASPEWGDRHLACYHSHAPTSTVSFPTHRLSAFSICTRYLSHTVAMTLAFWRATNMVLISLSFFTN